MHAFTLQACPHPGWVSGRIHFHGTYFKSLGNTRKYWEAISVCHQLWAYKAWMSWGYLRGRPRSGMGIFSFFLFFKKKKLFRSLKTHWSFTRRFTFAIVASCICRLQSLLYPPPHTAFTGAVTALTLTMRLGNENRFWSTNVYFRGSTIQKLNMKMILKLLSWCRYDP